MFFLTRPILHTCRLSVSWNCLVLGRYKEPRQLWCFYPTDNFERLLLLSNVVSPLLFNLPSQVISIGLYLSGYLEDLFVNVQLHFTVLYLFFTLCPVFQCPVSSNDFIR